MEGVAYSVAAAGTGGHRAGTHALKFGQNGQLARRHVADGGGDIEGRDPVPAPLQAPAVLSLGDGLAADAAGDDDAALLRGGIGHIIVLQRLLGGGYGELGEAACALGLGLAHVAFRLEALDLRRQTDLHARGVEVGDGRHAADAVFHGLPALVRGEAHGGDGPQAGDDDSASVHNGFLLLMK